MLLLMLMAQFYTNNLQRFTYSEVSMFQLAYCLALYTMVFRAVVPDKVPPNAGLNATQQIQHFGYPVEIHEIITDDGYVLQLHRIPHGLYGKSSHNKTVVFLMPGLMCSSGVFVTNGRNKSLAFMLADLNYDVWIGNGRGTIYSRKHVTLDPDVDNADFFNFTLHEVGYYDTRNSIDYILNATAKDDLIYIGHSQGTTNFFILVSMLPEYNSKIRVSVNMAPVVFMSHAKGLIIHTVALFERIILFLAKLFNLYEIAPFSPFYTGLTSAANIAGRPFQILLVGIATLMTGFDYTQFNLTQLPVVFSVEPAGGSIYQFIHYAQYINTGKFRQFDYGLLKNKRMYGESIPPDYDLTKATAPVAIYYAANDLSISIKDVDKLATKLPNLVKKRLIPYKKWNHLDYLWAKDVDDYLYNDVIDLISKY